MNLTATPSARTSARKSASLENYHLEEESSESRQSGKFPNLSAVTAEDMIFLTGVTGFLGGAMAAELMQCDSPAKMLFLIRADSPERGLERLRTSLEKFDLDREMLARLTERNVICGDLMDVAAFAADPRLDNVTYAVNCAGVTSFGRNPNIRVINVQGTLELAKRVAAITKLRRFIHVSTAMICGSQPPRIVSEDGLPHERSQHFVPYTESKAEAETLLIEIMRDRPFVIVRPTIIVGHTRLGCQPSHSIFWAFRMGHVLRATTAGPEGLIDVVPVDYAAQAILHLMAKPVLGHALYHIGSGRDRSSTFAQIDEAFCRALGRPAGDLRLTAINEIMARKDDYPALFGPCNKRFMQGAVKLYGSFASLNTVFDISRLHSEGALLPPRFADYLGVCANSSRHMTIADQALTDF